MLEPSYRRSSMLIMLLFNLFQMQNMEPTDTLASTFVFPSNALKATIYFPYSFKSI